MIELSTSWCATDIRISFGEEVEHMTNEEIDDELERIFESFTDYMIESGWNAIYNNFEITNKENGE